MDGFLPRQGPYWLILDDEMTENTLRDTIANENALAYYGWPLGDPLDAEQTAKCYAHADRILALAAERGPVMPETPSDAVAESAVQAIASAITTGVHSGHASFYAIRASLLDEQNPAGAGGEITQQENGR